MLILRNMRRCVLILLIIVASLGVLSCSPNAQGIATDVPELICAIPSDALCVGVFSRLDHGMDRLVDSLSTLRRLDYGKLSRAKSVVALCDVGAIAPLLVIEAGKTDADTLEQVRSLMDMADSLRLGSALVGLSTHNALLLSTSPTVITVACRHIASESSILDAPDFDLVLPALTAQDAVILRNRGASKLMSSGFGGFSAKQVAAFIKEAAEWTVESGQKVQAVYPESQRYFCNFMDAVSDGASKLASAFPNGADAVIDLPVSSLKDWRGLYEGWLDARIELEAYQKRISSLKKSCGKDPLAWEKELGVKELACVMMPGGTLNMVRTSKNLGSQETGVNPNTGFVRALYGSIFNASDSCRICSGNWIISGERALLDSLKMDKIHSSGWPASAKVVVWTPEKQINWTKENIKIWNSNQ